MNTAGLILSHLPLLHAALRLRLMQELPEGLDRSAYFDSATLIGQSAKAEAGYHNAR